MAPPPDEKPLMEAIKTALEPTKVLAGSRPPEWVIKIRLEDKAPAGLDSDNEMLEKINPDWKF